MGAGLIKCKQTSMTEMQTEQIQFYLLGKVYLVLYPQNKQY